MNEFDLISTWSIDSMYSYTNGKEEISVPNLDDENIVGSIINPRYWKFTPYNEIVMFHLWNYQDRIIARYKLKNDTLDLGFYGAWVLESNGTENLVATVIDSTISPTISVYKFYMTRRHPEKFHELLIGKWTENRIITKFDDDEIEELKVPTQTFIFTKDSFSLVRENQIQMKKAYFVKEDSLIIKGWRNLFIQKINKSEMILSEDPSAKLFGLNSNDKTIYKSILTKIYE